MKLKRLACRDTMLARFARLFVIKTRLEACMVIYALATGAAERGRGYLHAYPGWGGWLLFVACLGTVLIAGAKIMDAIACDRESAGGTDSSSPSPRT